MHRLAEERSLAYHRAVASRVVVEPTVLARARARVRGWLDSGDVHAEYARAWEALPGFGWLGTDDEATHARPARGA